jgi:hypothetical protein
MVSNSSISEREVHPGRKAVGDAPARRSEQAKLAGQVLREGRDAKVAAALSLANRKTGLFKR